MADSKPIGISRWFWLAAVLLVRFLLLLTAAVADAAPDYFASRQPSLKVSPSDTETPTPVMTDTPTPTPTFTITPPPTGILRGHLTWQGIAQPNTRNITPTGTLV